MLLMDLDRIEVVKGPQGTLFGRNASAGAISLISNKPGNETELDLGIAVGDEGQRRYDVVANLAVNDQFAMQFNGINGYFEAWNSESLNPADGITISCQDHRLRLFRFILLLHRTYGCHHK